MKRYKKSFKYKKDKNYSKKKSSHRRPAARIKRYGSSRGGIRL